MEASDARLATSDGPFHPTGAGTDELHADTAGADPGFTGAEVDPKERSRHASQRISALGEMTRGIAHDFRNVLALIESGLRLAETRLADAGQCQTCLAPAHQGVERGLALTTQLLAFATPGNPAAQPAGANELLRNLAPFVKYGAGPGTSVRFDLADHIPDCLIEPSQFNAAVLNLVVNARDAMPGGGEIRISTASHTPVTTPSDDAWLRVSVSDDGEGMSPETVARVFDPYFTTKGDAGTGLGVPQVQAFMRAMGGHVLVSSKPGKGTRFDLLFPPRDLRRATAGRDWRCVVRGH